MDDEKHYASGAAPRPTDGYASAGDSQSTESLRPLSPSGYARTIAPGDKTCGAPITVVFAGDFVRLEKRGAWMMVDEGQLSKLIEALEQAREKIEGHDGNGGLFRKLA